MQLFVVILVYTILGHLNLERTTFTETEFDPINCPPLRWSDAEKRTI